MAVFFNGAFMRSLRRETVRRARRDLVEHTLEGHHLEFVVGVHPFSARHLFTGLGTRRLFSARSKLSALRSPKSTATGTPRNQYSSNSNQSRSSVGHGRQSQSGPTRGTSGTRGSTSTTGSGRTSGTSGTKPTNFQRYSSQYSSRKRHTRATWNARYRGGAHNIEGRRQPSSRRKPRQYSS